MMSSDDTTNQVGENPQAAIRVPDSEGVEGEGVEGERVRGEGAEGERVRDEGERVEGDGTSAHDGPSSVLPALTLETKPSTSSSNSEAPLPLSSDSATPLVAMATESRRRPYSRTLHLTNDCVETEL